MHRRLILSGLFVTLLCIAGYIVLAQASKIGGAGFAAGPPGRVTQGALQIVNPEKGVVGECPLKHTDVKAEISGFIARVVVTQQFENILREKIEAVYTFPLPVNAAVDDMTMHVGGRTVRGRIKRREEARAVYETARAAGNVASLLDQERPNIFTQSVANIMPGEKVDITISYVEILKYEEGSYEFVFPMVVGPRYIPGAPVSKQGGGAAPDTDRVPDASRITPQGAPAGKQGGGWAPDTDRVPDASRITPQVAPELTRAGHDVSIEVALDAGVPLDDLKSTLHEVDVERRTPHSAFVSLRDKAEIPNKDFILKFDVAGRRVEDAVLTHRSEAGGFFTMILQPPDRVTAADVMPKELVFVLDTSGSMSGFPIEKAKETMRLALDGLYPQDTFNLITFSGDTHILFPKPVPATADNLEKAKAFLASRSGAGGTEMMKAIQAALDPSDASDHVRIVCFMTDGYVGNDMEIISEIQKHPNARVFAFGIGSAVNRFLLDKMAEHGRGEVEYVTLKDDGSAAAKRFHERVRAPLLTDISVDWSGLPITDVYPKRIPDLFSAKPVLLSGRYSNRAIGVVKLKGKMAGRDFVREIPIELPQAEARHDVLATLWARTRIDDLMSQDFGGIQTGNARPDIREAITELGLKFRLMTQFTSFVAVEETIVTDGSESRRIEVPVDMPEGVSHSGVFGRGDERGQRISGMALSRTMSEVVTVSSGRSPAVSQTSQISTTLTPKSPEWPSPPPPPPPAATPRAKKSAGTGTGSGGGTGSGAGYSTMSSGPRVGGGDAARIAPPSPDEQKRMKLLEKLHPSIVAIIERLASKSKEPTPDEASFVRDDKAAVQIWLTDKSAKVMADLKKLGFEVVHEPKKGKMIIGRMPIEALRALADMESVLYAAPMITVK